MSFEEGHKLAKGRPKGSRNKLGREFDQAFEEAKDRGYTHPYLRMMEIANDESQPTERRDTMLLAAASYACPKAGTIQHQLVSEVSQPTSIEHAENILAQLFVELAPELDPVQLSAMIRTWIESKRAGQELDLKVNPPETRPQIIQVVGGLPIAPGHEGVLMPGDKRIESAGKNSAPGKNSSNGQGQET
jgi:hypothetical protein